MILMTFLFTFLFFGQAQEKALLDEFIRQDISNERREELMELIMQQDLNIIAPLLLKINTEHATPFEPGMGPKPWLSDRHSHRAKIWYASGALWEGLFHNGKTHNQTEILLKLLRGKESHSSIYKILSTLRFFWNQEAEQAVFDMFQASNEKEDVRGQCLQLLLEKNGQKYTSKIA